MEGDGLHLGTVDLLVVGEEEPVGYPDIKEFGVPSVLFDELKANLVAVPAAEEDSRISLLPGNSPCLLSRQDGE